MSGDSAQLDRIERMLLELLKWRDQERDRPVEITQQMIETGIYELARYEEGADDPSLVVRDIFRAMLEESALSQRQQL